MQHRVSWSGVFLVLINFTFPRPSQPICVCVPSHFPYTIFIHIILFIIYNIYYYTNTQILQYMCSWPSVRWACSTSVLSSSDDFVTTTTQPGPICISCHTIFNCLGCPLLQTPSFCGLQPSLSFKCFSFVSLGAHRRQIRSYHTRKTEDVLYLYRTHCIHIVCIIHILHCPLYDIHSRSHTGGIRCMVSGAHRMLESIFIS